MHSSYWWLVNLGRRISLRGNKRSVLFVGFRLHILVCVQMEFSLVTTPISEETRKIAEVELRETPEVVKASLVELRELLKNDTTIHYRDDDEFLTIFLRPCKWYAKSALQLVSTDLLNSQKKNLVETLEN